MTGGGAGDEGQMDTVFIVYESVIGRNNGWRRRRSAILQRLYLDREEEMVRDRRRSRYKLSIGPVVGGRGGDVL